MKKFVLIPFLTYERDYAPLKDGNTLRHNEPLNDPTKVGPNTQDKPQACGDDTVENVLNDVELSKDAKKVQTKTKKEHKQSPVNDPLKDKPVSVLSNNHNPGVTNTVRANTSSPEATHTLENVPQTTNSNASIVREKNKNNSSVNKPKQKSVDKEPSRDIAVVDVLPGSSKQTTKRVTGDIDVSTVRRSGRARKIVTLNPDIWIE